MPTATQTIVGSTTGAVNETGQIRISEVLPAPRNLFAQEWIELINLGSKPVDLRGWKIADGEQDGHSQALPEVNLAPGAVLLVELQRALLNNSGDTLRLLGLDGAPVDSFTYTDSKPDLSFSRNYTDGSWSDQLPPSPGEANPQPLTPTAGPSDPVSIAEPGEAGEAAANVPTEEAGVAEAPPAPEARSATAAPLWQVTAAAPYRQPAEGAPYHYQPTPTPVRPLPEEPDEPALAPRPDKTGLPAALVATGGVLGVAGGLALIIGQYRRRDDDHVL